MTHLDPEAQALLDAAKSSGLPPVYTLPVAEARQRMRAGFIRGEAPLVDRVDFSIPGPGGGLGARLYARDVGSYTLESRRPLILFFHGGGWTVNDLDTHDRLCDLIADRSGCSVLSVDYRRGPEHPYPAAIDDAWTALMWAQANPSKLAYDGYTICVAGDSSGGTIAAALALLARDRRGPMISLQVLLYPALDYLEPPTKSYVERATGYSLNRDFMQWSWDNFLPESWSLEDPYLFPLRASNLHGLPPAIILTAEFDPLRDEGIAYAHSLAEASLPRLVTHWHLDDQMHGFAMQTGAIARASKVVDELGRAMGVALNDAKKRLEIRA